jgi:hypothetical protein
MATGFYLLDHPPVSRQYGDRFEPQTGCVVVHTPESFIDVHPPDNGAENVAAFIAGRRDAGSYHELVDSDTFVQLIPDHLRAFHVAATGVNQWSWGISIATSAHEWGNDPQWDARALRICGERIAAYAVRWARLQGEPELARLVVRWITARDAYNGKPGLIHHGQFQQDRTDAWERHPLRAVLDGTLIDCIDEALDHLDPEGEDMTPAQERKLDELLSQQATLLTRTDLLLDHVEGRTPKASGASPRTDPPLRRIVEAIAAKVGAKAG